MKVKCINDKYLIQSPYGIIEEGLVYTVRAHQTSMGQDYYFLEGIVGGWMTQRFVVVEEDATATSPTATHTVVRQEKPCQVCSKSNDVGVATCWCCGNQP
jgi:hypothetical protein